MNITDTISLFLVMATLAAVPSSSVVLVVTRTITHGLANGVAVSIGIVLGDLCFILLAVLGLSVVAESMGWLFLIIKYICVIYLIWLGYNLITSKTKTTITAGKTKIKGNIIASFLAGLFLTFGDLKAIFFYITLFPAFVNLTSLQLFDVVVIMCITIISVGGVKIFYVFSARKAVVISQSMAIETKVRKTAGIFMLGIGSYLAIKT